VSQESNVPRISEFYGIVIFMYYRDHEPAHFHAWYGEYQAVIGIDPIRIMEGRLPTRARALVLEWASLHQAELQANWRRALRQEALDHVAPLD
jgi:hypothetical protein